MVLLGRTARVGIHAMFYPRVLLCVCVFVVTAMHVWSPARCVWEWRPYIIHSVNW